MKCKILFGIVLNLIVCICILHAQTDVKTAFPRGGSIIDPKGGIAGSSSNQGWPSYHAWLCSYIQAYNENYQYGIRRLNNSPGQIGVTPINGALVLADNDLTVPGRISDLPIVRTYNSKIWSADSDSVFGWHQSTLKYDWNNMPWMGCGWDLHFGKVRAPNDNGRIWETPSGTQVYFKHKSGSDYISTDGAFRILQTYNDSIVIKTGDGSRLLFAYVSNSIRYLTKILDPNGNITNFYYSSGYLDSLTTSTKRKVYFHWNCHDFGSWYTYTLDSIKYKGFENGNNKIVFHYNYDAISQYSPFGDTFDYGCTLLKSVIYPNGDSVYYDYNTYFELQCVHTSSGGSATYEYGTYNYWIPNIAIYPPDDQTETTWKKQYTREVTRMISDDEWSNPDTTIYSRSLTWTISEGCSYKAISNPDSIRITDPEGNYIVYYYDAARRKYLDGSWGVTKGLYYYGILEFVKLFNQNNILTKKAIYGTEAICRITSDSIPVIKRSKYNNGLRTYQTNYYGYDGYGNPCFIHQLGDTSITTDERWIRHSYYTNDTKYIIHCLKVDSLCSDSVNYQVLSKTNYNYDEANYIVKTYSNPAPEQWETPPSPSDTRGNLTSIEYWKNGSDYAKTEYRYDNVGNIVYSITHPTSNTAETTFTYYDPAADADKYHYAFPWRTVNHLSTSACSLFTRAEYDSATGLAIRTFDANGDSTVYSYDNLNRPTKVWFPNDDSPYKLTSYRNNESPEGVIDSIYLDNSGGSARWAVSKTFYNGFGNVIQTKEYGYDGSNTVVQNVSYNGNGLVDSVSNPYKISGISYSYASSSWTDVTTFFYDGLNRPTKIKYPTGDSIRAKYYANTDTVFDEKSNKTVYIYDAYGAVDTVIGAINDTTIYRYDTLGRLTKVIDAKGKETKYYYDKIGDLKGMDCPDMDSGYTYAGNKVDEYYAYDDISNLLLKKDRYGWTRFTYDDIYRLAKVEFSTDSSSWTDKVRNLYDIFVTGESGNSLGHLTKMVTVEIDSTAYSYDDRGNMSRKDLWIVGLSGKKFITYKRNNIAQCTLMTLYPSTYKTIYQYNAMGQINAIPNLISSFSYKPSGAIYKITRPASNSVVDSFTYDTRLRPILIHAQRSGTDVMKLKYYYEANSNVDSIADYVNTTYHQGFAYDGLNRLTNVYSSAGNQTFSYDKVGNRTSKNGTSYQYWTNTNKLKLDHRGDTTYYDNNGNTTRRRTTLGTVDSFAYDWNDRLIYFKKITTGAYCDFAYNASGLRIKKHYYDPGSEGGEGQGAAGTLFSDGSNDLGILNNGADTIYNNGRDIKEIWAKYDASYFYFTIVNRAILNESGKMKMFITLDIDTLNNSGRITLPEDNLTRVPTKAAWEYCIYVNDGDYGLYKKDGTKISQPFGIAINKVFGDSGQIKLKISKSLLDNIPAIRYTIATFDPNAVNSDSLWQGGSSAVDVYPGTPETFGGEINGYGQISGDGILTVTEYTIYYIYNGIEPIVEYSSDGSILARYVYANGMHIAKIAGADTTWYHCDALGSPRKVTNESGRVTWTGAYYPFGEMITGSGNVHGFTGKELDSEMDLNYFCQRYYDPQIGNFTQLDPLRSGASSPYAYCANNPLKYTDPLGLTEEIYIGYDMINYCDCLVIFRSCGSNSYGTGGYGDVNLNTDGYDWSGFDNGGQGGVDYGGGGGPSTTPGGCHSGFRGMHGGIAALGEYKPLENTYFTSPISFNEAMNSQGLFPPLADEVYEYCSDKYATTRGIGRWGYAALGVIAGFFTSKDIGKTLGAAALLNAYLSTRPYSFDRQPHHKLGPHIHWGKPKPGSAHPPNHWGPVDPNFGTGRPFTWKDWWEKGTPWRWK